MRHVKAAMLGAAIAAPVVLVSEWLGVNRHDFQVFLLGQMVGATAMLIAAVWVFRCHRP